jgi:hypothetical protein
LGLGVIGYRFRDGGINDVLANEYLEHGKKIIVVDIRKPDGDLISRCRDQFVFIEKGINKCTMADFDKALKSI